MCRDLGAAKLVAASAWHVGSPVCRVALRSRSLLHECDVTVSRPAVRSATPEGSELGLLLSCVLPEFAQLVRRIVSELKHFESEEGVSVGERHIGEGLPEEEVMELEEGEEGGSVVGKKVPGAD